MLFKKADFENWLRRPIWTLEEGIQLLFGIEPKHNVEYALRDHQKCSNPGREIIIRLDIGDRSIKSGKLKVDGDYYPAHRACELYPATFLSWVKSNGWEIPDELAGMLSSSEPVQLEPVEKNLDTRERTTLLQIIAALAAEAELDLEKHSKAAETLLAIGAKHGLEMPKKKDTIAGKLKDARDLQKTR